MNQDNNFNTQGYNNFSSNQVNQPNNNFYQPPTNSQPPKKSNLGLIIGIATVVVVAVVGVILGSKLLSKDNDSSNNGTTNNSGTNNHSNIVYNDSSRDIKSTYTFDEATSKFAFKEYETTLIFQQNNNFELLCRVS